MTDFQVGDVVICVDDTTPNDVGDKPTGVCRGHVDRVTGLHVGCCGEPGISLEIARPRPGLIGFKAFRFRKIEAADEQFTEQMRALRPVPATLSRSSENRNG